MDRRAESRGKDTYNIGAKDEMRVVRKAIVRAIEVWKSANGYTHRGCYVSDTIAIAVRVIRLGVIDAESGLVAKGRLGRFLRLNER